MQVVAIVRDRFVQVPAGRCRSADDGGRCGAVGAGRRDAEIAGPEPDLKAGQRITSPSFGQPM